MNQEDTSKIIKGCWQFSAGHSSQFNKEHAIQDLISFADEGITTFDCADIYTGVEELLGQFRVAYRTRRGEEALQRIRIHTKFVPDLAMLPHVNRAYIEGIVDRSLMRLGVQQLDLVQFHWWDFTIPGHQHAASILLELKREGKVRRIGVTNYDAHHLQELLEEGIPVETNQVQYSLLDQRPATGLKTVPTVDLLCYGTVAGGFLSERFLDAQEPRDNIENRSLAKYKLIIDEAGGWEVFQVLLHALSTVAQKHGVSMSAIATKFVLTQPNVRAAILGGSIRHKDDMLASLRCSLDKSDLSLLSAHSSPLRGNVYELERDREGPHGRIMRYNLNQ